MTLTLIIGDVGSGKTLLTTYLVKKQYELNPKKPALTNYPVDIPSYLAIEPEQLMKLPYDELMMVLDEGYEWLDARLSATKVNIYFSYILFQSRKRGMDIYVTVQEIRTLDIRYKEMANIIVYCEKIVNLDNADDYFFKFTFIVREILKNIISTFIMDKSVYEKIYPLYQTKQIVESDRMVEMGEAFIFSNKNKLRDLITKATNDIEEDFICNGVMTKITKNAVENSLLEHNYPTRLTRFVYAKLKHKYDIMHS